MSSTGSRDMVAQVVIILAVCVGGWMMFVEPQLSEQSELKAAIAAAKSSPTLNQTAIEKLAGRLDDIRSRATSIRRQNRFAEDSSRIYGSISELAANHGVTLRSLNPGQGIADGSGADEKTVRAVPFDIVAEGAYESIASFVTAIESVDGFIRPVSVALAPRQQDGRNTVEARIVCEAMHFRIPESLAALAGGDDGNG